MENTIKYGLFQAIHGTILDLTEDEQVTRIFLVQNMGLTERNSCDNFQDKLTDVLRRNNELQQCEVSRLTRMSTQYRRTSQQRRRRF